MWNNEPLIRYFFVRLDLTDFSNCSTLNWFSLFISTTNVCNYFDNDPSDSLLLLPLLSDMEKNSSETRKKSADVSEFLYVYGGRKNFLHNLNFFSFSSMLKNAKTFSVRKKNRFKSSKFTFFITIPFLSPYFLNFKLYTHFKFKRVAKHLNYLQPEKQ